jgi:hypothetical protein
MDNMTSGQQIFLFFLIAAGIVACVGDYITTVKGLAKGFIELNPINRWLFSKIGQPLTAFIEIAMFVASTLFISVYSGTGSMVYAAGICALETFNTIRNYKAIK